MYLVVAATEMEMQPVRAGLAGKEAEFLLAGVGPVETALVLTRFLERRGGSFDGVINCGVAGAYGGTGVHLLDLCLAEQESLGDLGICLGEETAPFPVERIPLVTTWRLDAALVAQAKEILAVRQLVCTSGPFVTVSGVSGTATRGAFLRDRFSAICENMEGAAVARVCEAFHLPCLEIRCVSNLVEDRDPSRWKLEEACRKGGAAVISLILALAETGCGENWP